MTIFFFETICDRGAALYPPRPDIPVFIDILVLMRATAYPDRFLPLLPLYIYDKKI